MKKSKADPKAVERMTFRQFMEMLKEMGLAKSFHLKDICRQKIMPLRSRIAIAGYPTRLSPPVRLSDYVPPCLVGRQLGKIPVGMLIRDTAVSDLRHFPGIGVTVRSAIAQGSRRLKLAWKL